MTYFIYNHRLTGEQLAVEGISIASDHELVWQGEYPEFEALGFNSEHIGGLEIVNGLLSFNQSKKDGDLRLKLPLAMGKGIVAEIELAVASKPITERLELVKLFNNLGFKELLLSSSCNPLRAVDVPDLLEMFNNSAELNIEVKGLITNIINSYLTTHKLS
jgi:hypothetical protein